MQQFSSVLLTMSQIIKQNSSEKAFKLYFLKELLQPPSSLTFTPVSLCTLLLMLSAVYDGLFFFTPPFPAVKGWFGFALFFKL